MSEKTRIEISEQLAGEKVTNQNSWFWVRLSPSGRDLGFFRFGDYSGLGNLLFPWARYIVACDQYGWRRCISPTWPQIAIGPILRGESDLRFYRGLFKPLPWEITGIRKFYILSTHKLVDEKMLSDLKNILSSRVVAFSGLGNGFQDIFYQHDVIRRFLLKITKEEHKKGLTFDFSNSISVHIRRGDFKLTQRLTSINWFIETICLLRSYLGKNYPVYIFSDGSENDLREILSLGNVKRLSFGSSIADLLALSRANILVASRGSTFSAWAAFLGRMPVIWPVRKLSGKDLYYRPSEIEIVRESGQKFPEFFINYLLNNKKQHL